MQVSFELLFHSLTGRPHRHVHVARLQTDSTCRRSDRRISSCALFVCVCWLAVISSSHCQLTSGPLLSSSQCSVVAALAESRVHPGTLYALCDQRVIALDTSGIVHSRFSGCTAIVTYTDPYGELLAMTSAPSPSAAAAQRGQRCCSRRVTIKTPQSGRAVWCTRLMSPRWVAVLSRTIRAASFQRQSAAMAAAAAAGVHSPRVTDRARKRISTAACIRCSRIGHYAAYCVSELVQSSSFSVPVK
jgi:hypothetical protein